METTVYYLVFSGYRQNGKENGNYYMLFALKRMMTRPFEDEIVSFIILVLDARWAEPRGFCL